MQILFPPLFPLSQLIVSIRRGTVIGIMVNTDSPTNPNQRNIESTLSQINNLLQPHGIIASAEREKDCLYVLLESDYVPDRQQW